MADRGYVLQDLAAEYSDILRCIIIVSHAGIDHGDIAVEAKLCGHGAAKLYQLIIDIVELAGYAFVEAGPGQKSFLALGAVGALHML